MENIVERMTAKLVEKAEAAKRQAEEAQAIYEAKKAEVEARMKEAQRNGQNYPT